MFVMVKPGWPGSFHRSVFGPKGERLRLLKFDPGEVYEVEGDNLAAITGDLDLSLVEVFADGKDRPRTKEGIAVALRPSDDPPGILDPIVPAEAPPLALAVEDVDEEKPTPPPSQSHRRSKRTEPTETPTE